MHGFLVVVAFCSGTTSFRARGAPEGGCGPREGGFRLCAADEDVGVPGGREWKNDEGRKRQVGKV